MKRSASVLLTALICISAAAALPVYYNGVSVTSLLSGVFSKLNAEIPPDDSATAAAAYTWNQTGTASFATATNWTPTRTTPATDDILVFNNGATTTATGVITQTVGQIIVSGNTTVNLQASGTVTLTISGGTGTDLDVQVGSALNANSASGISLAVATTATGSISGTMSFTTGPHRLTSADASGVTFNNGATFTAGTGFTGSPFGTTSLNSVVFANGSVYVLTAGGNPFGASSPNSVVVFQTGSTYRHQTTAAAAASGRTYPNFEYNAAGSSSVTGASSFIVDNLTISQGTFNYAMTGTPGHSIKGNISVASGATLSFSPASAGTVNLNGTTAQTISGSGALSFGGFSTIAISNASGVTLQRNIDIVSATMNVLSGGLLNCGTNVISGASGNFQLLSGGSLGIGSPAGITFTTTTGNIQTGNQTFSSGANYIYNGAANQVTGNALANTSPSANTVNNLTIANTGAASDNTVTLGSNLTVGGTLAVNGGVLGSTGGVTRTVTGTITVGNSGSIAPGASAGKIAASGNVSFATGSNYKVEIGGTTEITQYDQLSSGGAVSLANASLNISSISGFVPGAGNSFKVIDKTSAGAISGTFNGLSEGAVVTTNFLGSGLAATISYIGGDGNDVVVTANAGDTTAPSISYTPFVNTGLAANRTLSVSVTDAGSGIPTSGTGLPVIYYRKSTLVPFTPNQCVFVSGSNYDCTIDYSLIGGIGSLSTIRYFVAAQDNAGNVAVNPASGAAGLTANPPAAGTPPTPNQYDKIGSFSGSVNVGTGETYTNLTNNDGIFQALNNDGTLIGDLTINITSDLTSETGTNALRNLIEEGAGAGTYRILIKPSGGPRLISGSINGELIKLNGADRVTIDGWAGASLGGFAPEGVLPTRDLTIQNTAAAGTPSAVFFYNGLSNPSTNNAIQNVNIQGNTATLSGITIGGIAPGGDNDNNSIINCQIKGARYGIFTQGVSEANPNLGTVIRGNVMNSAGADRIRRIGIVAVNENGIEISQNEVSVNNQGLAGDAVGIGVGVDVDAKVAFNAVITGGVTNANVTRNKIVGVVGANDYGAHGIAVAGGTGGANTISNNMITGVISNATSPDLVSGIFVAGVNGSSTKLFHNSVSLTGDRSTINGSDFGMSAAFAVAITGTDPLVELKNNIFSTTQDASQGNSLDKTYAIGTSSTTFANLNSDFNIFWSGTPFSIHDGGFRTGSLTSGGGFDYPTLGAWEIATGQDADSSEFIANFLDPVTNLHVDAAVSNLYTGTSLAGVTTDFDGEARSATIPDIGADEFTQFNPGLLSLTDTAPSANEGTTLQMTVSRTGGSERAISADYTTVEDGAAVAETCGSGGDFVAASGTLNWAEGDTTSKTFDVTICADAVLDGGETFRIDLINPTGGTSFNNVSATVTINEVTAPEIAIDGGGAAIPDGDTTATVSGTNYGTQLAGSSSIHTFTVSNTGTAPLTLGSLTSSSPGNFVIAQTPTSPVAPGGTTTFKVQFVVPFTPGDYSSTISLFNTDSDESPYDFLVKGTSAVPEINVQGNSTTIASGDLAPSTADHTDFGNAATAGGTLVRTFTIQNTGGYPLSLSGSPLVAIGGTNAADFAVTAQPATNFINASGSLTFQVTFDPSDDGVRTGTVSIANSDSDENPYTFAIQGTGAPAPTLGNYANVPVGLSGNMTVTPDAVPTNTTSVSVLTTTGFKGTLAADPATGVVRVTDAHPAGTYAVTVRAFGLGGTVTKTFNLTVQAGTSCVGVASFTNGADVTIGSNAQSTAVGDFNGDGKQDLAVANSGSANVTVRLGDGSGGFTNKPDVSVGSQPLAVAVGDLNGDGRADLVTANASSNNVSVRLGDGTGLFTNATDVPAVLAPAGVAIGDFNGDGRADLVIANAGGSANNARVVFGNGAGGFGGAVDIGTAGSPYTVVVGDFNGDGKRDFASSNVGGTVSVRLGDGAGGFTNAPNIVIAPGSYTLTVGDFNNDGKQDLAVPVYDASIVSIQMGDGAGNFTAVTPVSITNPFNVAVGDFNNDGNQDIAAASSSTNNISIHFGNGAGGFSGTTDIGVGSFPRGLAVGDFNGDGKQDFAASNAGAVNLSVRLGICQPTVNLSVGANSGAEAAGTQITVTATASFPVAGSQTVSLAVGGTNITAGDYSLGSSTITIPNSGTQGSTTFTVANDSVYEGTETATLTISNLSSGIALGATTQQNISITDNDTAPTLSINDVTHNEGNSGTTSYTFIVTKTGTTELNATVDYNTANGSATAPSDFTAIGATNLTFLPSEAAKQFTVFVNGDTDVETDESFTVHLSNASGSTIADADGTGTITNDDTANATLVVDNLSDDGSKSQCVTGTPNDCSLRGANSAAVDGDTIVFDPNLFSGFAEGVTPVMQLSGSEISITQDITIQGPGADKLVISANNSSRVFYTSGVTVVISGMELTGGNGNGVISGLGGAILANGGSVTLDGIHITGNSTGTGGGFAILDSGSHFVRNSTIAGNTANAGGAASFGPGTTTTIQNCTISGNTAVTSGGGFVNDNSVALNIHNTTVTANTAAQFGGGIYSTGNLHFGSTIIAGNGAGASPEIFNSGAVVSEGFNLVGDQSGDADATNVTLVYQSTDIKDTPPQLAPLQDNGGPTPTHKPSPNFPGHDKGCAFGATTDQRGYGRTQDWPLIANGNCTGAEGIVGIATDIGAVELLVPTAAHASISGRALTSYGRGLPNVVVGVYDPEGNQIKYARTNSFGYFIVFDVPAGSSYVVAAMSKRYRFAQPTFAVALDDNVDGLIFIGELGYQ